MTTHQIVQGYADASDTLIPQYEKISSADLYAPISHLFPKHAGHVLDIGAGTGRDAAWFASAGHEVLAVEPVAKFRDAGAALHDTPSIKWLDDTLPPLGCVLEQNKVFDVVMLSAVWQHLTPEQRVVAMPNLALLTAPRGLLIISVRHGLGAPSRPCFEAVPKETIEVAESNGLQIVVTEERESVQSHNRAAGIKWTWLAFSKPAK